MRAVKNVVRDDEEGLRKTVEVIKAGGTVVYPTDTLYGLGCALNDNTLKRVYEIKQMPPAPFSMVMSGIEMVKEYAIITPVARKFLERFPAGPFTLLLPAKERKDIPSSLIQHGYIGIRIPLHRFARALAEMVGPVISTSANLHGEAPPIDFTAVKVTGADIYVDGGRCTYGVRSTILKAFSQKLEIIREGALSHENVKEYLEEYHG